MTNKFYSIAIAGILAGTTLLTGCKKSFLDDPKPGTTVSPLDVFGSDQGVRAYFNGIYRRTRQQYGTSTDAWGITAVNIAREAKGLDLVLNANWYNFDYQHDNREPTYRRTVFTWDFFYDLGNQANTIIDGVEKSALGDASKTLFLAEARALRAWCYFELVREFAHAYSKNPEGPGIPIYKVPTTGVVPGNPRSKISEVFNFIIEDLTFATANLGTTRPLKDAINKNVANGLLARVYLEKGDWANASTAAQAARTGYNLNAAEYNSAFVDYNKLEVMWGFPQAADQSIFYGSPSAFWGATGTGYFNFFIDSTFVPRFKDTDVRKGQFYLSGASDFRKWRTRKFGTTTSFTDHIIMMRVAEMYLIEAEAKARQNDATAKDVLFALQKNRDASAVESGNTGDALIAEILLERRKELYGEIGVSFLDIKRLGLPFNRSVGHVLGYRFSFPANDNRFTLKIPQKEFDANQNLSDSDQNP